MVAGIGRPGSSRNLGEGGVVRAHVDLVRSNITGGGARVSLRQVLEHVDVVVALAEVDGHGLRQRTRGLPQTLAVASAVERVVDSRGPVVVAVDGWGRGSAGRRG